MGDLTSC